MRSGKNDPPTGKKQLRDRKKERTRKEIIAVAERLYSEKPLNEVLLEDIAEAAFVSRTTIYNYFENKKDVLFAVGNKVFKELNETIAATLPAELSGKEQVLFLCAMTFKDGSDNPIVLKVTRDTFDHIREMNLMPESIIEDINKKLGHSTLNKLIGDLSPLEDSEFGEYFEDHHFYEFFVQLLRNGELWMKAIRKGRRDGSIKNDWEDSFIVQYLTMLMNGLLSEMELRRTASNQTGPQTEIITDSTLSLIAFFLDHNIRYLKDFS
ncbi:MAG TPA: TetR/AcrR family transcriptional regulator [Conexivisphaerales archaeon]|nr:TetR/AcrR family transcriptional regulator [Conexivisphaerales archaeon]